MLAFLALIPTKDWLYGGIIVALLLFGIHERNHLMAEGEAHEAAALKTSSDKLQEQTAAQTADLQAKATLAEQAYDKERNIIANLPSAPAVRLCSGPAVRGSVVSQAGAQKPGDADTGTTAAGIQSMPSGNSSAAGPDLGPMLRAFSARADQVSATLREYQNRE
jgi:hypothetical protein